MRRRTLLVALCAAAPSGCDEKFVADLSAEPHYKAMIGARYEVVGKVDAYGIARNLNHRLVNFITLIPPPGIAGPEVVVTTPLDPGSTITVLRVLKTNRWPDPDLTLIVRMAGKRMPVDVPVRIDLFGGNEGEGRVLLNPKVYRRRS